MTRKFLLAVIACAAVAVAAGLLFIISPSAQSRSDPPTCSVRSPSSAAPAAKAPPFAGGDTQSTSSVAATVSAAC